MKILYPFIALLTLLLSSLLLGAIFSFPLYLLINLLFDYPVDKAIKHASIVSGFFLCIVLLQKNHLLNRQAMGFAKKTTSQYKALGKGILIGLVIMALVEILLLVLGIHIPTHNIDEIMNTISSLLLSSILIGLIVATIEETLFRGLIFSYLQTITSSCLCIFFSALLYSALHYLHFPELNQQIQTGWLTGLYNLPSIFEPMTVLNNLHSFFTIFALGILLAIYRLRDQHIFYCIGVHAGVVMLMKVSRKLTDDNPTNHFPFLASPVDHQLGLLASMILTLFIIHAWNSLHKER